MKLLHCTHTARAVGNILKEGFAFVARPTKTAHFLFPASFPSQPREPQQFGMICFRSESENYLCPSHQKTYGQFAIAVTEEWAISKGMVPVRYISRWSTDAYLFRRRLKAAAQPLFARVEKHPGDRYHSNAFHNAVLAGSSGAGEYARLLLEFQYFAPARDRKENEWRIVNPYPVYSISKNATEAIQAVSPAKGWAQHFNVLKAPPEAIRYLIAPDDQRIELRNLLPVWAKDLDIRSNCAALV